METRNAITNDFDHLSLLDGGHKIGQLQAEVGGQIGEIINTFLDTLPRRLRALNRAYADRDASLLYIEAHKLKGAAAMLGAERLSAICLRMEQIGKAGGIPDEALLRAMKSDARLIPDAMKQSLPKSGNASVA
ncbi:MAG: Hpt domain-containing protein [Magnetococcales bacterium]|nr:Hpt domain-containing protein [Magnetococcales bacterium]